MWFSWRSYVRVFAPFYCPTTGTAQTDSDCDGVPDECDNCAMAYNPTQMRTTDAFEGDACLDDPQRVDTRCIAPPPADGDGSGCACLENCSTAPGGESRPTALFVTLLILVGWRWRRSRTLKQMENS